MCNKRLQESPEKMLLIITTTTTSKGAVNKSMCRLYADAWLSRHKNVSSSSLVITLSLSNNDGHFVKFISGHQMNVQGQY